jgi:4-hydroxythreonine-4-phosphate dehydrogenase
VKALPGEIALGRSRPIVFGDSRVVQEAADRWIPGWTARPISNPSAAAPKTGQVDVLDMKNCDPAQVRLGKVDAYTGEAAYSAVVEATEMAKAGRIDAIVTAPLNKEAMHLAGHKFDGHTGLLGHLCETKNYFMLLGSPKLRAIHVSTHVSVGEAVKRVKRDRVLATIRAANDHLKQLGFAEPRIGVCGLNPHAGENRLFGAEDEDEIRPACDDAIAEGINAIGPIPADSGFRQAYEGKWDVMVVMYHDQGHVPMKLIAFDEGVNVTVGLPIIRTSVDHGTAFDIAGQGIANPANMSAAIDYAYRLATGSHE